MRITSSVDEGLKRISEHLGWEVKKSRGSFRVIDGTPVNSRTGERMFMGQKYDPDELLVRATQHALEIGMTPKECREVTMFCVRYDKDGRPALDIVSGTGLRLLDRIYNQDHYEDEE